nr:hypothetical protein [Tanacetum cinerariifolium]
MVNVIPPDHVDEVPVVEPNQHDDVPVVPEPILVDENEDPKEDEFEEEEDPQEEDDMKSTSSNEVRSSVKQGTAAMEKLVKKLGNTEDKVECKGFVFEERPNEAINVLIEDVKSPSSEPRGSPPDL